MNIKIEELLAALNKKEEEKEKNTVLWVLAIIGAVAAVAGIAFAVYHFFAPDYLEVFEENFDDNLDNFFKTKKNNYRKRMKMRMAPAYTGAIFMKAIKRRRLAIVHGMDSNKF